MAVVVQRFLRAIEQRTGSYCIFWVERITRWGAGSPTLELSAEGGHNVAVARAFVRRSPILILDEPTSAMARGRKRAG